MSRAVTIAEFGDTNVFSVDGINNRLGIGTTQPDCKLHVAGGIDATSFTGDGSSLTGIVTGTTLSAGSGDQRVVVTSLTSGTMTSAATDAELTYNSTTNTLSATTFSGALTGNVTGNASGSSGSCSGNSATATVATNAQGLTGTPDITVGNIIGVGATLSGVLTYEDVTNIDSVGIVTARLGIKVGAGESIGPVSGTITYYGDGSNLTGTASTDNINAGSLTVAGISTFNGDAEFKKLLQEPCNIVASNLTTSPFIDLENGMFYYFSTNETGVGKANIRYSSTEALMSKMEIGDTVCVTLMTRPNNAGYNQGLDIDSQNVNVSWLGGSQPVSANSGGWDLYTYQIIKHSATGTYANDTHVLAHIVNFS